ncbi:MAG: PilZ domain-containing protein [Pseudolabrys sp.]|jgi:hypothetical protein|nr:PilZ domain-containing protein [Pseudolabrys sp.]
MDNRRASRNKSFLRGFVYFGNGPSAVDCTVRDISDTGARLKFVGLPASSETLTLTIPAKGQTFKAKVIWQQSNEIGIAFLEVPAAAVEKSSDADLSVRVEKLEAEIASLKHLIREIRQGGTIASDAA